MSAICFSRGGRLLLTGSLDTTIVVWKLPDTSGKGTTIVDVKSDDPRTWWRARESIVRNGPVSANQLLAAYPPERVTPLSEERLDRLMQQLEDDEIEAREEAWRQLAAQGRRILPWVETQLKKEKQLQATGREYLERLREHLAQAPVFDSGDVGRVRAVLALLEMSPGDAVKKALEAYAAGPGWSYGAELARRGLKRFR